MSTETPTGAPTPIEIASAEILAEINRQISAGVWHLSPEMVSAIAELRAALRRSRAAGLDLRH